MLSPFFSLFGEFIPSCVPWRDMRDHNWLRHLQQRAGKSSCMCEEINCLTHQILKSKLFEISLFSLLKKKKKKKFKLTSLWISKLCVFFPPLCFCQALTAKRRQCKGLLHGPQRLHRLWTQWRKVPICPTARGSSLVCLLGARGSQMLAVRAQSSTVSGTCTATPNVTGIRT